MIFHRQYDGNSHVIYTHMRKILEQRKTTDFISPTTLICHVLTLFQPVTMQLSIEITKFSSSM